MTYLKGYVDHIRFRNEDNGYTVLSLDVDGDEETVVGLFPFLHFHGGRLCGSSGSWTAVSDEDI